MRFARRPAWLAAGGALALCLPALRVQAGLDKSVQQRVVRSCVKLEVVYDRVLGKDGRLLGLGASGSGTWTFDVLLDDRVAASGQFVVEEPQAELPPKAPTHEEATYALDGAATDRATGEPVEGVLVFLLRPGGTFDDMMATLRAQKQSGARDPNGAILAKAATDADGLFRFAQVLAPGTYPLIFSKEGFKLVGGDFEVREGEDAKTVVAPLDRE